MRPLEYKNIGEEKHLTFDSIRRMVLKELSDLAEKEASDHIQQCPRCRSIQQSLAYPADSRKNAPVELQLPRFLWVALILISIAGLVMAAFFYLKEPKEPLTEELPIEDAQATVVPNPDEQVPPESEVAPVLEAIDTLSQINEEPPTLPDAVSANKKFDNYIEKPPNQVQNRVRGIYGKITNNGDPVSGVTVMTPGSNKAKVTDHTGKYYIQVSNRARSLIFIYQGKQVVKTIPSNSRRLDLQLNFEEMTYPSRLEEQ